MLFILSNEISVQCLPLTNNTLIELYFLRERFLKAFKSIFITFIKFFNLQKGKKKEIKSNNFYVLNRDKNFIVRKITFLLL